MVIADFRFISVLGKGVYAQVVLAESKVSKKLYAIKVFDKERLVDNDDVRGTKAEKSILMKATQERHPFIVQMHGAFQTETRLFLVMEYVSGGDLCFHMKRQPLSQESVRLVDYGLRNGLLLLCWLILPAESTEQKCA